MGATLPLTIGFPAGAPRRAPRKAPARGDTPALTSPASSAAGRNPVYAAHDIAAWIRHAEGANGFGGDAVPRGPLSYPLLLQARAHRSALLGALIATTVAKVAAGVREAHAAFTRGREARVMRKGLHELDARTLRDIGFTRSEIDSVIAEATGGAEWTRLRTRWMHGQP
jgi:uncharacterized protein YjiS (DUF1127 family)